MEVVENSLKTHKFAPFFKIFLLGGMPPNPPSKSSQLATCRFAACISKITKNLKLGPPPLRNPAYAPECNTITNIKIGMRLTLQLITN